MSVDADTSAPVPRHRTDLVVPARLKDRVLLPGDAHYEAARLVDNAAVDCRPAAIVRAHDVEDVRATLALAQASGTALAVRAGGHSTPGYGVADDAVVLDVSGMRGIEIDAGSGTAWIESGVTAGEATATLHRAGFAIPFGDSGTVGVGGLTLGGGIGWLVRRHGLTIDSLLAVEVVTAAGDRLTASAVENPELFWALRGGGGNFGVVTRFRFNLTPIDTVVAGRVNVQATPDVLRELVDVLFGAPDGLTVIASVVQAARMPAPDTWQGRLPEAWHGRLIASLRIAHSGPIGDDERVLDLLRSLGPTAEDSVGRRPYPELFPPPGGTRIGTAVRTMFLDDLDDLDDQAIEIITQRMTDPGMPDAWIQMRVLGGAAARVANDETAFGHRDRRATATLISPYEDLTATARHEAWVAEFEAELLAAGCGPGAFVSFLGTDGEEALYAAYPPATLARLADVKRRFDPGNLFRSNLNVRPAPAAASG